MKLRDIQNNTDINTDNTGIIKDLSKEWNILEEIELNVNPMFGHCDTVRVQSSKSYNRIM